MKLPENVVPMPAEQRAELKRLAQGATPGPWAYRSQEHDDWGVVRGPLREDGHRVHLAKVTAPYASQEQMQAHREAKTDPYETNGKYIAAVSPDITLATFAYVEALEAEVALLRSDLDHCNKVLARGGATGQQFTHDQVATKVRMLCRGDLDHEMVCVLARDRIIGLAKELSDATSRATKAESRAEGLQAELAEQETAALQWAKTLAEYNNELSRLRTVGIEWIAVVEREPFAFVPYLVAVKQDEGLNKGETTTLKRTCCWDSIEKVWVRHGVSPRSILTREVTHYAEIPAFAAPTPPPSSPAAAGPGEASSDSPAKQARKKAQAVLEGRVGPASLIQPKNING